MLTLSLITSLAIVIGPIPFMQSPEPAEPAAVGPTSCATDTECPGEQICEAAVCADPPAPVAGCSNDLECKGERICVEARCQAPPPAVAPVGPTQPAAPAVIVLAPPAPPPDNGWALGGGIGGLALTVPALLMAIGSDVTREEQVPSLPIGAVATIFIATGVPIAFAGAQSARRGAQVQGGQGLMITSWVFYGLALSNAIALIGMGVSEVEPPPGVISLTGVLGLTSGVLMSVAAFVAHKQATEKVRTYSPQLSLGVAPLRHGDQPVGGTVGLSGRF